MAVVCEGSILARSPRGRPDAKAGLRSSLVPGRTSERSFFVRIQTRGQRFPQPQASALFQGRQPLPEEEPQISQIAQIEGNEEKNLRESSSIRAICVSPGQEDLRPAAPANAGFSLSPRSSTYRKRPSEVLLPLRCLRSLLFKNSLLDLRALRGELSSLRVCRFHGRPLPFRAGTDRIPSSREG